MASPELELQGAIFATLAADADLVALGSGVYDMAPRDAPLPYVTIGPMDSTEEPAMLALRSETEPLISTER